MLNSGKKICALCDKKNKYSNSRAVRKKKHSPPCKLNGRSLTKMYGFFLLFHLIKCMLR